MRSLMWFVAAGMLGALSAARAGDADAFFNGKDLAGWEGLIDQFWSVKDNAIVGATPKEGQKFNTFLCSKKKYKDFELQFQVKMTGDGWSGNSGVQIRSRIHNAEKFAVTGPQCDMGGPYWGSLYGENFGGMMKAADAELVKEILKVGEFNDYYIKCVDKHVTIKLNGKATVDDDFAKLPDEGIIAWQLHAGASMEVIFRNIRFAELKREQTSMKALLVIFGMLGLLSLSTQLFRHMYVGWIAPTRSVLDNVEDKKEIVAAQSLDELLVQYEEIRRKVREWEAGKTQEELSKPGYTEPFISEDKLKVAIRLWESRNKDITELHFYWWCGVLCLILGLVCFFWANRWLGLAVLTTGFVEMIYWTSPSGVFSGGGEFERLLTWKLFYTVVSLAGLLGLWWFFARHGDQAA